MSSYSKDYFLNAKWTWHYNRGVPAGIWAYCPRCDTQLVYSEYYDSGSNRIRLECEHCNSTLVSEVGSRDYLVAKIARQIDRNIRTGEWKKHVQPRADA